MEYITMSMEDLKEECYKWGMEISKTYTPDIIVYVAKAGFPIGREFAEVMKKKLVGVETIRAKGNKLKCVVAPIVRILPVFFRNALITAELKSGIHKKNSSRIINFIDKSDMRFNSEIKKVLVVDDSVDTGASMLAVVNKLEEVYTNAEIKTAGLNVWDKSKELIKTDFFLYENTVIKAPMSKDSKEYNRFVDEYNDYRKRNESDLL